MSIVAVVGSPVRAPLHTQITSPDEVIAVLPGNPLPQGAVVGLRWDGHTYQPTSQQAETSVQKFFTGPVDPTTLPGVVVDLYDQWILTDH